MKAAQYLRFTVVGVALLGAGGVMADDLPLPTDPAQQREKMRSMSSEDRTAYREQMQTQVRNMTPQEQQLMRDTSSDGRANMNIQSGDGTGQRSRDGSGQGGQYGKGYESRQGAGSSTGTGTGGGGRGMGRGRGG